MMDLRRIRHPANFRFADRCTPAAAPAVAARPARQARHATLQVGAGAAALVVRDLGDDVFHVELADPARWPLDPRTERLDEQAFAGRASTHTLAVDAAGGLTLAAADGTPLLHGAGGRCFGVCGEAWLVRFDHHPAMRFYGQGHKVTGLEKSGRRTKFWNVDVWADHAMPVIVDGQPDPQYVAIPYLLVRTAHGWAGLLVDHPGNVFMDTASDWIWAGQGDADTRPAFWFGADHGVPAFHVIAGTDPAEVTRRLQRLVGTTPLPPLWALGHHQCRWGYAGPRDLQRLDAAFTEHAFPCDGLWLDIDYMDGFRVFTTSPAHFEDPAAELKALEDRGRRVVAILDPGVKAEPGYAVADDGLRAGVFCLNPEGLPYTGFVWPGRAWFPDFSLPAARDWWAGHVRRFRETGFHGAWIDMNDPSTGAAELDDMRFGHGTKPHWTGHNTYAIGMAQATRDGFLAARPDERPFLISRSASTGAARTTGVWTGDNWSNWHHLRGSIAGTLNLALSGVPLNAPDVPGFGGDADADLAVAWYQACFLFPFLRNHALFEAARQEPWAFGAEALQAIRHVVRLRYKLLPYLYQLWVDQEATGAPVLRPLFLDFADADGAPLDRLDDQFMVGPALLQAPRLQAGATQRDVVLPGAGRWFDARSGRFEAAGRHAVPLDAAGTPLYVREGTLLPMQPGERTSAADNDLADLELHVLLGAGCNATATLAYAADDGASFGYRRGVRTTCTLDARRVGHTLHLQVRDLHVGWRPLRLRVVGYDGAVAARIEAGATSHALALAPHRWAFAGAPLAAACSAAVLLDGGA